jgi:hypothetical protein
LLNKFWNFLTKDLSAEEIADLEKARGSLERYEKIYSIYEYVADFTLTMNILEIRQAGNNPSIPMTIYKKVINNI